MGHDGSFQRTGVALGVFGFFTNANVLLFLVCVHVYVLQSYKVSHRAIYIQSNREH